MTLVLTVLANAGDAMNPKAIVPAISRVLKEIHFIFVIFFDFCPVGFSAAIMVGSCRFLNRVSCPTSEERNRKQLIGGTAMKRFSDQCDGEGEENSGLKQ